ncbi:uncharacterized protein C10orf143 homolog isoform X2 [Chelonia mydas]|uniref:uncharacterized protein C10orf143 homolog isoform X2 n=1 Tax=Chelonia mydas TaxID=8469 RepID=UPI000FFBD647|nr:uncharacterized protein C10orf143 homolog isoform X2 [Chelonia mydas]XP_027675375.1 uncharacterized protein C10orf143 homolog isoform X2 [Chelonia mydas]XP_027675380.1 uncharacterized protein C10orf143 homolog isoform X2 [Chelonia mydas]XP_037759767.1 uncharacterized protein C10orf143 homolog isoform X2 [Chelonia mydas]
MELLALHTRRRRGALVPPESAGEPERKRVCKSLEPIPNESDFCHQLNECAMDYWTMELDSKQKGTTEQFIPQTPKEKPNSMIFQNHGSKGTAQPCPRCIAGESGHFNHIMGF